MSAPDPAPAESRLYTQVQRTLLGGMIVSFALMGLGLIGQLLNPRPHPEQVVALDRLPADLLAGNPLAVLDLGLLVLLSIPVLHLLVAASHFARLGDRRYLLITGLVLGLLAAGAALAFLRS